MSDGVLSGIPAIFSNLDLTELTGFVSPEVLSAMIGEQTILRSTQPIPTNVINSNEAMPVTIPAPVQSQQDFTEVTNSGATIDTAPAVLAEIPAMVVEPLVSVETNVGTLSSLIEKTPDTTINDTDVSAMAIAALASDVLPEPAITLPEVIKPSPTDLAVAPEISNEVVSSEDQQAIVVMPVEVPTLDVIANVSEVLVPTDVILAPEPAIAPTEVIESVTETLVAAPEIATTPVETSASDVVIPDETQVVTVDVAPTPEASEVSIESPSVNPVAVVDGSAEVVVSAPSDAGIATSDVAASNPDTVLVSDKPEPTSESTDPVPPDAEVSKENPNAEEVKVSENDTVLPGLNPVEAVEAMTDLVSIVSDIDHTFDAVMDKVITLFTDFKSQVLHEAHLVEHFSQPAVSDNHRITFQNLFEVLRNINSPTERAATLEQLATTTNISDAAKERILKYFGQ